MTSMSVSHANKNQLVNTCLSSTWDGQYVSKDTAQVTLRINC